MATTPAEKFISLNGAALFKIFWDNGGLGIPLKAGKNPEAKEFGKVGLSRQAVEKLKELSTELSKLYAKSVAEGDKVMTFLNIEKQKKLQKG